MKTRAAWLSAALAAFQFASGEPEGVQALIDLAKENARESKLATVAQVVDYTFVEKARKELSRQR